MNTDKNEPTSNNSKFAVLTGKVKSVKPLITRDSSLMAKVTLSSGETVAFLPEQYEMYRGLLNSDNGKSYNFHCQITNNNFIVYMVASPFAIPIGNQDDKPLQIDEETHEETHEETNYKALCEALRRDMQDTVEILLSARRILRSLKYQQETKTIVMVMLEYVNRSLHSLDYVEHHDNDDDVLDDIPF